jgi:glycine/D-amino acid oxidase-like deaminating enzyme
MKEHFNVELNETEISVRDCCRPLTPDDKMILCRIDSHNNVFVNAGHGSRGMSHCHACAEVIYQLMRGHTSSFAEFDISRFFFV